MTKKRPFNPQPTFNPPPGAPTYSVYMWPRAKDPGSASQRAYDWLYENGWRFDSLREGERLT